MATSWATSSCKSRPRTRFLRENCRRATADLEPKQPRRYSGRWLGLLAVRGALLRCSFTHHGGVDFPVAVAHHWARRVAVSAPLSAFVLPGRRACQLVRPLTGFMTLWHGFSTIAAVCWLPWLFVAIDATIKKPGGWGLASTALLTALVLLGGHFGIAGLVLLTTGFYAVWRLVEAALANEWPRVVSAATAITSGWLLGFAISAAVLLPFIDYVATGARRDSQLEGAEERPPQGWRALPTILRPDVYGGGTRANWTNTASVPLVESSSCAYAGLLGALRLAPLAWSHRSLRRQTTFWTLLLGVSLGWTLNIPGVVDVLRSRPLRPLASLSYNRWTFATSMAILILSAIGLDSLVRVCAAFSLVVGSSDLGDRRFLLLVRRAVIRRYAAAR